MEQKKADKTEHTEYYEAKEKAKQISGYCPGHAILAEDVFYTKAFIKRLENIEVQNGKVQILSADTILKEVWEATMFSRDRRKVYKIFMKYPVAHKFLRLIFYRLIPAMAGLIIVSHFYRFEITSIVKWFFRMN